MIVKSDPTGRLADGRLEIGVRALVSRTPNVAQSRERARSSHVSNASFRLSQTWAAGIVLDNEKRHRTLTIATALRPQFERPWPTLRPQFEDLRHNLAGGVLETSQSAAADIAERK